MNLTLAALVAPPAETSGGWPWAGFGWHAAGELLGELRGAHLGTMLGFGLALLVVGRMFLDKRNPSNIFAWGFLIVFIPWLGAPLYFLFGGRKNRRLVRAKQQVNLYAAQLAAGAAADGPPTPGDEPTLCALRKFPGNTFDLLPDGVAMYEALRREIAGAQKSIHLQTFILGRDEYARQIVTDLTERAKAGVEVKLLLDALGSLGAAGLFVQPLRRAGGRVARFLPVAPVPMRNSANLRNHRKCAIFDRERVLVGGQNLDRRFVAARDEPGLFHDFGALLEGPVAAAFNRALVADWCFAAGDSPRDFRDLLAHRPAARGPHVFEVLTSGPDVADDPLWERLLTLVQQCDRQLDIVTPYFIPDEVLFRLLLLQAHLGKRVRLIVPEQSNHPLVDFARHHYLRQLDDAGVEVLLYRPRMLHAKLVVVDNRVAMMGSANMDLRSLFVNFELGVLAHSPEPVGQLAAWLERLLPGCVAYAQSRHAAAGANRRLMEDFAHLLGPLL